MAFPKLKPETVSNMRCLLTVKISACFEETNICLQPFLLITVWRPQFCGDACQNYYGVIYTSRRCTWPAGFWSHPGFVLIGSLSCCLMGQSLLFYSLQLSFLGVPAEVSVYVKDSEVMHAKWTSNKHILLSTISQSKALGKQKGYQAGLPLCFNFCKSTYWA